MRQVEVMMTGAVRDMGLPEYKTDGAAAIDLYAAIPRPVTVVPTGPAVDVPTGLCINLRDASAAALLFIRSGHARNDGLYLANGVGLIDSDYQGEIVAVVASRTGAVIRPGDRFAQLMLIGGVLRPKLVQVDQWSKRTRRGSGGLGSTGKRQKVDVDLGGGDVGGGEREG